MTENRTKRFVLSLLLVIGVAASQAQNSLATLEYWLDADYANRQTASTDGSFAKEIDVSGLRNGIHTIEMRVSDTEGRWGSTLLRYFLKADPTIAENQLAKYEYWIDNNHANAVSGELTTGTVALDIDVAQLRQGLHSLQLSVADKRGLTSQTLFSYFLKMGESPADRQLTHYEYWIDNYSNVQSGTTSDGTIQLDIDVSSLCKGIHTLGYQVQDNKGSKSAPQLVYFLIPDLESGADVITAYEYWFNCGPRTRVEFQPASQTVSLSDVIIEVKDIVPNSLEGYHFDAAMEQVTVDDNVFFGIQVCTADNRSSMAALSETFPMTVPVDLNMKTLSKDGEPLTVAAPTAGRMQGMKSETAAGDSLFYALSLENVMADFYDAAGNQLEAEREVTETGQVIYALKAASACTYMLVYGASEVQTELTALLVSRKASGVSSAWADDTQEVARYNVGGQTVGAHQRGVNIVRMSDGSVRKVVVK